MVEIKDLEKVTQDVTSYLEKGDTLSAARRAKHGGLPQERVEELYTLVVGGFASEQRYSQAARFAKEGGLTQLENTYATMAIMNGDDEAEVVLEIRREIIKPDLERYGGCFDNTKHKN